MKRLVLSAVALSMLAMPVMQAEAAPLAMPKAPASSVAQVDWKKPVHVNKHVVVKKKVVVRKHWNRGEKYRDWKRHQAVSDWNRHYLRRPGHGQEWIRVGNDYLLVSILTGLVIGVAAAH